MGPQVPLVQWMSLAKVESRLQGKGDCLYQRATDMIADFHQITQNAEMYNAPGNGRLGNQSAARACLGRCHLQLPAAAARLACAGCGGSVTGSCRQATAQSPGVLACTS